MAGRNIPRAGEIYRHFKNKLYQIVTVATHTETGEQLVVYEALYDDFKMYARPLSMFLSEVDHKKYPDVAQFYRFELVEREVDGTLRMGYPIKVRELIYPEKKIQQERPKEQEKKLRSSGVGKEELKKEKEKFHMANIVQETKTEQNFRTKNQSENDNLLEGIKETNHKSESVLQNKNLEESNRYAVPEVSQNEQAIITDGVSANSNGRETAEEQAEINPFLLEFLDTDTYSEKLQVLVSIRSRLDDRLIDDMATAIDVTIDAGPLPERYEGLKTCLETRRKFECERLR